MNTPTLAEIKSANRIEDVIGDSVELEPAGGDRLKGLCAFHAEKTPSFFVFQKTQRFYCFGCGAGGDTIDFIMQQQGLSFPEALRVLGADDWRPSAAKLRAIQARQRRQRAEARREQDLAWTLGKAIRIAESILFDPDNSDWDLKVLILQHLETLKFQHSIFDGEASERAALVRDLVTITPFPRTRLFNDDFDYNRWNMEATRKQTEQRNEQKNY